LKVVKFVKALQKLVAASFQKSKAAVCCIRRDPGFLFDAVGENVTGNFFTAAFYCEKIFIFDTMIFQINSDYCFFALSHCATASS